MTVSPAHAAVPALGAPAHTTLWPVRRRRGKWLALGDRLARYHREIGELWMEDDDDACSPQSALQRFEVFEAAKRRPLLEVGDTRRRVSSL